MSTVVLYFVIRFYLVFFQCESTQQFDIDLMLQKNEADRRLIDRYPITILILYSYEDSGVLNLSRQKMKRSYNPLSLLHALQAQNAETMLCTW